MTWTRLRALKRTVADIYKYQVARGKFPLWALEWQITTAVLEKTVIEAIMRIISATKIELCIGGDNRRRVLEKGAIEEPSKQN